MMDSKRNLEQLIDSERDTVVPSDSIRESVWFALAERLELPESSLELEATPAFAGPLAWPEPPSPLVAANQAPPRWRIRPVLRWCAAAAALVGAFAVGRLGWEPVLATTPSSVTQDEEALGDALAREKTARARAEALAAEESRLLGEYALVQEVLVYEASIATGPPPDESAEDHDRQRARRLWEQGLEARVAGDLARAREAFELALAEDPTFSRALTSAGRIAADDGDKFQAERLFRTALEHDPEYRPAMLNLATLLIARRALDEAEPLVQRALHERPDDPLARHRLSRIERLRAKAGEKDETRLRRNAKGKRERRKKRRP